MCKCYICDKDVDEPKLDPRDMKTTPCSECEAVIQDCLDSFKEQEDDDVNVALDTDDNYEYSRQQFRQVDLDDAEG